jgi:hypothetical protein
LIGAFNHSYTPQEWLIKAGYAQRGNSFRHPHSETGNYSATVRQDESGIWRVNTLSSSDPLYTDGAHDAFSTFCTLFHGGDRNAALKDAGDNLLVIGVLSYNKAKQIEYAEKKKSATTVIEHDLPDSKPVERQKKQKKPDWKTKLDSHVAQFNKTHASMVVGGKHRIMRELNPDATRNKQGGYEFYTRHDLSLLHDNTLIKVGEKDLARGNVSNLCANHLMAWATATNTGG